MGTAALLTYVTLGRRRIDYRFVLLGAVLPDLVDVPLGAWLLEGGDRYLGHTLLAATFVAVVVVITLRGERRLSVFGVAVGWLLHLVVDGMWRAPVIFLWPAFGAEFPTASQEPYDWDLLAHPADHLGTWAAELVGALVLAWFAVAFGLGSRTRRRRFLEDGRLRP
jgi:inner membrane protein